jgi:hypothetical protein
LPHSPSRSRCCTPSCEAIFTDILEPPAHAVPAVILPRPPEADGTWSWTETDGTAAAAYDISPADTAACFPDTDPTLRSGRLKLTDALDRRSAGRLPGRELLL